MDCGNLPMDEALLAVFISPFHVPFASCDGYTTGVKWFIEDGDENEGDEEPITLLQSYPIQRAPDSSARPLHHVRINLRCAHVLMA